MAKICEYENVKCPFCGSEKVEHLVFGILRYSLLIKGGTTEAHVKVHVVHCQECTGQFTILCED